jgi:integrase
MNDPTRAEARARGFGITEQPNGRFRARIGNLPGNTGTRKQRTKTLDTEAEAEHWARSILVAATDGTHLEKSGDTFDTWADEWLATRVAEGVRPVTARGYGVSLKRARKAFGDRPIQSVTPQDVRRLMRTLAKRARATNRLTLYAVRGTFELALDDGLLRANPARKVKPTGKPPKEREELTAKDAALIVKKVRGDRLELAWLLTLAGLRRSEIAGIRWSDITDETATVSRGRVDMGSDSSETTAPKSERGARTLPLPAHIVAGMKRTKSTRRREMLALGGTWDEDAYIAVDLVMEPLRPEVYSDEWTRLCERAKVKKPVTLHGARHGSATRMLDAGIPVHVAARWHGHDAAVMLRTYAHADREGLAAAGEALAL